MTTYIQQYILPLDNIDIKKVLSSWTWLIGDHKTIIALTKAGDALFKDSVDNLYFLDTGNGVNKIISKNYRDFIENKLNQETLEEIFASFAC